MARKKTPLPPEDELKLEALPGIPIRVDCFQHIAAEKQKITWPLIVATAPMAGDYITSLDQQWYARITGRNHFLHPDIGPVLAVVIEDICNLQDNGEYEN